MRIAIDISPLDSGHGMRGIGVYTKNIVDALQKYDTKNSYIFITRKQNLPNDVDLVHYPYFDPFLLTLPLIKKKSTIVTVHDVIPLLYPDKFPSGLKGRLKWEIQKRSLLGSKRIIAVSECSKNDICSVIGFDKDRIDVVYSAPSPIYKPETDKYESHEIRKKYSLPEQYVVYVGDVNWNKNIPLLLKAFKIVREKHPYVCLVLVGKVFLDKTVKEVVEIDRLIDQYEIGSAVIRVGYVPDHDLCLIYQNAVCLVQPSFYEGFGFPVLEAMASGCPTVVSDNSSLHEILGPSVSVDASSAESISKGIMDVMGLSIAERKKIIRIGVEWSHRFTWEKTAKSLIESYERILR